SCRCVVSLSVSHFPQVGERVGNAPLIPQLPLDNKALLVQRACRCVVVLGVSHIPQIVKRSGDAQLIPQLPLDSQALLIQRACRCVVILDISHIPQIVERSGDAQLIPQLPLDSQALLIQRASRCVVTLLKSKTACPIEGLGSYSSHTVPDTSTGQGTRQLFSPFAQIPTHIPEPPQSPSHPQAYLSSFLSNLSNLIVP